MTQLRLLAMALSLLAAPSTAKSLHKRADDYTLQSLVTLVQQQAGTISAQQASIAALQGRLGSLETASQHHSQGLVDFDARLNDFSARMNTRVSFTAHMTTAPVTITDSPFLFDAVVSNVGNGYNPQSGVFTAPVSGDYVFYVQIQNHAGSDRTDFAIVKGSQQLCANELDQMATYDKASCLTTVRLQQGEAVFVRRLKVYVTGSVIEGNIWSSFSGQLIAANF